MKILVIGESCQDVYVRGTVNRLCPEAPVPVINPVEQESNSGMAANVYANIKSIAPEADVLLFSQNKTIVKTRYVDSVSGYILLRVDEGDIIDEKLNAMQLESYFIYNGIHPKDYTCVLISDYNKGFLTEDNIYGIVKYFKAHGVPVLLDTKKILGEWSKEVEFVKINEREYKEQFKIHKDPSKFCKRLIVTLGARGSRDIQTGILVCADEVEVSDVSGAGDTYFAAFAVRYYSHEERDIIDAMGYANKASAVAVSKRGVVAVQQSEIK